MEEEEDESDDENEGNDDSDRLDCLGSNEISGDCSGFNDEETEEVFGVLAAGPVEFSLNETASIFVPSSNLTLLISES